MQRYAWMDKECLTLPWKHPNLRGFAYAWQSRKLCSLTKTATPVRVLITVVKQRKNK